MTQAYVGQKRIRRSYGNIREVLEMPNLIEVQKSSYDLFLNSGDWACFWAQSITCRTSAPVTSYDAVHPPVDCAALPCRYTRNLGRGSSQLLSRSSTSTTLP